MNGPDVIIVALIICHCSLVVRGAVETPLKQGERGGNQYDHHNPCYSNGNMKSVDYALSALKQSE